MCTKFICKFNFNKQNYFQNVFINYAPGDNGAIGAALVVANKYYNEIENLQTPYLGSEYSNNDIKKILEDDFFKAKFSYEFYENDSELFKSTAKLIFKERIWFQGKWNSDQEPLVIDQY